MGQVKNKMMMEQEQEFDLEWSYQEWLRDHGELTDLDIEQMELDLIKRASSTFYSGSISNNLDYGKPQGA